ncbi:hypothetical protein CXB51_000222 [Gossypium anomalum]|uniref:Cyclase n=1 Tax=Gossypium anomalum TaxID=47600 RepID=A0A8J5Z759_9ROSI|nr:hypothetical protein CXB51_000222 [Gossypium anomalum]
MTKTMFLPLLLLLLLSAAAASTSVSTECTVSTMDDYPVPVRREVYGDGRIFDISHRYTMDMPSWERKDGLGRFLWLPASMKNGSLANNSLMKLPTHSGTHVDAPGHMIDRYFDAGFDVDTLDLEVLNGPALLVDVPRDSNITAKVMESRLMFKSEYDSSYVGFTTDGARWLVKNTDIKLVVSTDCTVSAARDNPVPVRREVYGDGRIFDISHRYTVDMPSWGSKDGLGQFLWLPSSMKNGSRSNNSLMKLQSVHSGTHVDAPGHMVDSYFDAGFDVDTLDLDVLNGPALLVDVPRDSNITAKVMESLNIPKGVRREFDSSYAGFTTDGARWLAKNTDIKLVGIDFLSAACYDHSEIILVEGLKLDNVPVGIYNVHCLPLRLLGSEGSPIRCILIK